MKTFTFPIPQRLRDRLKAHKVVTGVPEAEIIRRAIDLYLPNSEHTTKALGTGGRVLAEFPDT